LVFPEFLGGLFVLVYFEKIYNGVDTRAVELGELKKDLRDVLVPGCIYG
jgi:hypothetical protein